MVYVLPPSLTGRQKLWIKQWTFLSLNEEDIALGIKNEELIRQLLESQ